MPFDLNILCWQQRRKTPMFSSPLLTCEVMNRSSHSYQKCYCDHWYFINHCDGFWYYLLPKDESEQIYGCYCACTIEEKTSSNRIRIDEQYSQDSYFSNLPVFGLKSEYLRSFENAIDFFIKQSPINTIIFLPRFQGDERDIVRGVFSRNEFFRMIRDKSVKFNTCYIIRKD